MGHYVVARATGFRTGDVSLSVTDAPRSHRGQATVVPPQRLPTLDALRCYLSGRIAVLFAGAAAETLLITGEDNKVNESVARENLNRADLLGAGGDMAKVHELLHVLRNISYPATDPLEACRAENLDDGE